MNAFLAKLVLVISFSILSFNSLFSQNIVKCWNCEGYKKVEEYIDPYECQVCKNWNSEYRRKVACHACQDTRENQRRRTRIVICSVCKGTGRDFAREKRLKEFGSNQILFSSTSYSKINVNGMIVNAGDMVCRIRDGNDRTEMDYPEAVQACNSLGAGWRLPTFAEMNQIFRAYEQGQKNLELKVRADYYWTSTTARNYSGQLDQDLVYIIKEESSLNQYYKRFQINGSMRYSS